MYQDKLANLKDQLAQLEGGTHPEYVSGVKKLEEEYSRRIFDNKAFKEYEVFTWTMEISSLKIVKI